MKTRSILPILIILASPAFAGSEGTLWACIFSEATPTKPITYHITRNREHCLYTSPRGDADIIVSKAGTSCTNMGKYEFIDSSWGNTCRTDDKYVMYTINSQESDNPASRLIVFEEHVGHYLELNKNYDRSGLYLCPSPSTSCNTTVYDYCPGGYCGDTYMIWSNSVVNSAY